MSTTLLWFRQDLRFRDNRALMAAIQTQQPVLCLYILDETQKPALGAAARWWLHHSLEALQKDLLQRGNSLVLLRGDPVKLLPQLIATHHITQIFWNDCYDPAEVTRDNALKNKLDVHVESFNSHLLFEPGDIHTKQGGVYQIFTPFWHKGCREDAGIKYTLTAAPKQIPALAKAPRSDNLASWQLLPQNPNWAAEFSCWKPGELGAHAQLQNFLQQGLAGYKNLRNFPNENHVSRLSPHLHWGEIAPWRVWDAVSHFPHAPAADIETFQKELGWREFSYYILHHFPTLPKENFKAKFNTFSWNKSRKDLAAWQQGVTGYPIVDAGMRELWHTGWMHNRVRMIVASFLIKDLLIDWRHGAAWFWDTLVDADLANNSASWQWVAGCGVDAAPYFRIFNPVTQSEKFDPSGSYIKKWLPELAALPAPYFHKPWEAPENILQTCHIQLGKTYPFRMIEHAFARQRALEIFRRL